MFDRILLWSHLVLAFCFFGRFLITMSISVLVIGLLIISISSWFTLGKLNFSKNLSISSGYPFYCHIVVHNSFFIILCISALFVVTSPFSFLILLIWFFSLFFLMNLAKGLSIFFIFTKNQLLVVLIFNFVSFTSFSLISPLIFMIYFLLVNLKGGCSSFSSCFSCTVTLSIRCFSCFLR